LNMFRNYKGNHPSFPTRKQTIPQPPVRRHHRNPATSFRQPVRLHSYSQNSLRRPSPINRYLLAPYQTYYNF
jgi:hypothetical protein